jgi:hypothetical protein
MQKYYSRKIKAMTNQKLTNPTFQELLTSQEARRKAKLFNHNPDKCSHWMSQSGKIYPSEHNPEGPYAIWQGWLQEAPELSIADTERDKEIADLQQTIGLLKHKIDGLEAEIEMLEADYGDRGWII